MWQHPQNSLIGLTDNLLPYTVSSMHRFKLSSYSRMDKSGIKKNLQKVKNVSILDKISGWKIGKAILLVLHAL